MPSFNLPISDLPWDASPAILLVIGSIAGLYTFYYFFLLPTPIPGIPYDHESAKKVLGDGPSLTSDPEGLAAWSSKHLEKLRSPICQALLGPDFLSKPIVLVADVGEIRDVLLSRSDFDRSSYLIDRFPLFGDFHLNMKTNEEWKLSRNWSKDLLNPQYMNDVASPAIEMAAKRLIKLWETKSRLAEGKPFDMNRDIKGLSIDVIMAFYFGDDVMDSILAREVDLIKGLHSSELTVGKYNTLRFPQAKLHKFLEGLVELSHTITSLYTTSWPPKLAAWWTRYIISSTRKYFSDRERAVRQLISKSVTRIQGTDKDGLRSGLDHMVWREDKAASKALRKPVYNKQIMVDEIYGALIAGQHTTSAAVVWIMKYLSDYPAVQNKLREEVQSVLFEAHREGRLPTASEINSSLKKLPYLRAVIEEMLRLRQAMAIPRDATRDTELLGCKIPKGTPIFFICQSPDPSILKTVDGKPVHSPREYPGNGNQDMKVFDPERWLVKKENGDTEFDGTTYPQLAFGGGVRACWGRKVADLEMQIVTALLVWKFDFLSIPDEIATHEATYDITYRAVHGYVRLRSRDL